MNLRIDSLEIEKRRLSRIPTAITTAKKGNEMINPSMLLFMFDIMQRMFKKCKSKSPCLEARKTTSFGEGGELTAHWARATVQVLSILCCS
jgi:hypothetical protein